VKEQLTIMVFLHIKEVSLEICLMGKELLNGTLDKNLMVNGIKGFYNKGS